MAKNLLFGVNEVLKKLSVIDENNLLTSLTNTGKQVFIDLAVQSWNESIDQLYSKADVMMPYQGAEDFITIVDQKRNYILPEDLIQIRWPLHEETEGFYISEYPGGYEELRNIQSQPANYTGIPFQGAISPIEKEIYLDRVPSSAEAGYKYVFFYWRDTVLERETDQFPFDNGVVRAMVPFVVEVWKQSRRNRGSIPAAKISASAAKTAFGRALRMVKQQPDPRTYIKRNVSVSGGPLGFDPYS